MGGMGCDNMTVILVCLLNNKSYNDLAEKCSKPPQKDILTRNVDGGDSKPSATNESVQANSPSDEEQEMIDVEGQGSDDDEEAESEKMSS